MREDYSHREVYLKLLEGIHQPSIIGFIGDQGSECDLLFGKNFENRVIPLVDSRTPAQILEPPQNLDYVVAVHKLSTVPGWAATHGFEQILKATTNEGPLMIAFEKKGAGPH
jgi:hypothetical protein